MWLSGNFCRRARHLMNLLSPVREKKVCPISKLECNSFILGGGSGSQDMRKDRDDIGRAISSR